MEKGEIARYEQFLLSLQCFQKALIYCGQFGKGLKMYQTDLGFHNPGQNASENIVGKETMLVTDIFFFFSIVFHLKSICSNFSMPSKTNPPFCLIEWCFTLLSDTAKMMPICLEDKTLWEKEKMLSIIKIVVSSIFSFFSAMISKGFFLKVAKSGDCVVKS